MSACDAKHPTLNEFCDVDVERIEDGGDGCHEGDHVHYGDLRQIRWANKSDRPERDTTDLRVEATLGDAFVKAYGLDQPEEVTTDDRDDADSAGPDSADS